jgi:hypothetical protein
MLMLPRNLALVVLTTVCFCTTARPEPASADTLSLDLDPAQSTVAFTLGAFPPHREGNVVHAN